MARKPTGRPPGRPPKAFTDLKLDTAKVKAMRQAMEFFNRAQMMLTEEELQKLSRMESPLEVGAKEAKNWGDVQVPADTMVPLKDLVPLTEEQLKKASQTAQGILGAVVAGFHSRVPELLQRLATWEPEKALKLYLELMEYITPRLQRVEQSGAVEHRHQVFVPVEPRENDPRLEVIDAEVVAPEMNSTSAPALPPPPAADRIVAGGEPQFSQFESRVDRTED